MSFRTEVIADSSGKFVGNSLRFATRAEAEAYVADLSYRWTSVRETRVVEDPEPANYGWSGTRALPLQTETGEQK